MTEPKRRKRAAISCTLCRRRKIRCNRETPCSNCVRSKHTLCIYEAEPTPTIRHAAPLEPRLPTNQVPPMGQNASHPLAPITPASTTSRTSIELETMRSRIVELEDELGRTKRTESLPPALLQSPTPTQNMYVASSLTGPIDILQESRDFGQAHAIARGIAHKNRVFGQSHWMNAFVVFRDVIELLDPQMRSGKSSLIADVHKAKILARRIKSQRSPAWPLSPTNEVPSKDICDVLVDNYLRTIESIYRILHIPSFRKNYETLWRNKAAPKTSFIMQLKLVLAIGAVSFDDNCSLRAQATGWIFEAQTWLSSPNFKSKLGTGYLQTSILLLLARELVDVGSELVWISAGALLRTAIYIGLHKDPTRLPRMTLFEIEIRRRLWNTILEVNLQFSLISGGPCFVSMEDFDTELPGNFDDEQLLIDGQTAKPKNTFTQTSVAITLRGTFPARLMVVRFLNDMASNGTYEETLRIDTLLRSTHKTLRNTLQAYNTGPISLLSGFAVEAVDFIMHRYISSLHIPFFNASLHEAVYAFSRKAVFNSSLKIWTLANPKPSPEIESDLARFCRCGAGFFRAFAFHASTYLAVELRAQLAEDDDVPRPDLVNICEEAAAMTLRTIEAGETGIKGYLLLSIVGAQVDCIRKRVGRDEMPGMLIKAAEQAVKRCLPVLERIANQGQVDPAVATSDGCDSTGEFDFAVSPNFLQDWDVMMSDVFNFDSGGDFDAFLD